MSIFIQQSTLLVVFCLFVIPAGIAESVHFDKDQLISALSEKIESEIVSELEAKVQEVETQFIKDTYIKEMLEPYKEFGIDPDDVKIYESFKSIYSSVKNNPDFNPKDEIKEKLQDLVKTRIINYIKPDIDAESIEIASQIASLTANAKNRVKDATDAFENISKIPISAEDYETQVTDVIRQVGFKGPIMDVIEDLEVVFGATYDKYADPFDILMTLSEGVNSNDPVHKIEVLFDLGSELGDRLPMVGEIVNGLFEAGKELLAAAKRTGGLLEKNFGQGCISKEGEYNQGAALKQQFYAQFPHVNRACPLKISAGAGVYNQIYYNEESNNELFFLINGHWFGSSISNTHAGIEDIRALRIWLKQNGEASRANDLNFLFKSYRKRPGFLNYKNQIAEKLQTILQLTRQVMVPLYICNDVGKEAFLMQKIGFSWVSKLMNTTGGFRYEDAQYFSPITIELMLNQMIKNRYVVGHKVNLIHLDNIIDNLKANFPVWIRGVVAKEKTLQGIKINTSLSTILNDNSCVQTETKQNGSYQILLALPNDFNQSVEVVRAEHQGERKTVRRKIDLSRQKEYQVNINFAEEGFKELLKFTIQPRTIEMRVGDEQQFKAMATFTDGEEIDVTSSAILRPNFNATSIGDFTIKAEYLSETSIATISVIAALEQTTELTCNQEIGLKVGWNKKTQSNECICDDDKQLNDDKSKCVIVDDWGSLQSEVEPHVDNCTKADVIQAFNRADSAIAKEQMSLWADAINHIRAAGCNNDRLRSSAANAINILHRKQQRQEKIANIVKTRPTNTTDYTSLINTLTELINIGQATHSPGARGVPSTTVGQNLPDGVSSNSSNCQASANKILANNQKLVAASRINNQSEMRRLNNERTRLVNDHIKAGCNN